MPRIGPNRRIVLSAGLVAAFAGATRRTAWAGPDTSLPSPEMTIAGFRSLTRDQIALADGDRGFSSRIRILGLNNRLSRVFLHMAAANKARTDLLLNGLARATTTEARRNLIARELRWADRLVDKFFAEVETLMDGEQTLTTRLTLPGKEAKLDRMRQYRDGLRALQDSFSQLDRQLP